MMILFLAGVNIEIERTVNGQFHSKTFDNASISARSSLFSKRSSVFEDYRGKKKQNEVIPYLSLFVIKS